LQKIATCFDVSIGDLLGENKSFSNPTTKLSTDSITDVVGYLMENNDTLIADPLFREYVKSNLEILEIEREQEKLEKKKQVIKDQISQVSQTKVSQ
jgi:hypothetical protein